MGSAPYQKLDGRTRLALAPIDDESVTPDEAAAIQASITSLEQNGGVPLEEALTDFGLTLDDFHKMAENPAAEDAAQECLNGSSSRLRPEPTSAPWIERPRCGCSMPWRASSLTDARNVKQLASFDPPHYRLRVGGWRIIFRKSGASSIEVVRVRNRREAYR